jgi:hypothetical protein
MPFISHLPCLVIRLSPTWACHSSLTFLVLSFFSHLHGPVIYFSPTLSCYWSLTLHEPVIHLSHFWYCHSSLTYMALSFISHLPCLVTGLSPTWACHSSLTFLVCHSSLTYTAMPFISHLTCPVIYLSSTWLFIQISLACSCNCFSPILQNIIHLSSSLPCKWSFIHFALSFIFHSLVLLLICQIHCPVIHLSGVRKTSQPQVLPGLFFIFSPPLFNLSLYISVFAVGCEILGRTKQSEELSMSLKK